MHVSASPMNAARVPRAFDKWDRLQVYMVQPHTVCTMPDVYSRYCCTRSLLLLCQYHHTTQTEQPIPTLRRPSMLVLRIRRMCWNSGEITSDCQKKRGRKRDRKRNENTTQRETDRRQYVSRSKAGKLGIRNQRKALRERRDPLSLIPSHAATTIKLRTQIRDTSTRGTAPFLLPRSMPTTSTELY